MEDYKDFLFWEMKRKLEEALPAAQVIRMLSEWEERGGKSGKLDCRAFLCYYRQFIELRFSIDMYNRNFNQNSKNPGLLKLEKEADSHIKRLEDFLVERVGGLLENK